MNTYHFWCYIYDKRDEKLVYLLHGKYKVT